MANNGTSNGTKKRGAQLDREIDEVLRMRQKKQAATTAAKTASGIPSQAEYERRELADARGRFLAVRRAPLSDRKEAQARFFEAMRDDPALVAERLGWLLDGSYGRGEQQLARQVLASPRMNRSAALTQMVGVIEWQVPEDMTRAAWKKLTKGQQAALEKAVQGAIREAEIRK